MVIKVNSYSHIFTCVKYDTCSSGPFFSHFLNLLLYFGIIFDGLFHCVFDGGPLFEKNTLRQVAQVFRD